MEPIDFYDVVFVKAAVEAVLPEDVPQSCSAFLLNGLSILADLTDFIPDAFLVLYPMSCIVRFTGLMLIF